MLRFSHYDQVVRAAIDGSGVAIGRNPHIARHLREGLLVAPLGREAVVRRGAYFVLVAPRSAERPVVKAFVAWLREEAREDAEATAGRRASRARRARPRR
jgi:DNA-binding transcriptional LysR family regulator